jgi:hypothetical protein
MMQIIFGLLKKITEFKKKNIKIKSFVFSKVLYKFTGICPQYPNCLKKFQKIKIDLYKEPLSNSGKTES